MGNKPRIRFKGFTEDWEQRKLGEIADITKLAGFEFTKYIVYSDKGNIIALRGLNIKDGDLNLEDVKYIDSSDFTKLKRSKLFRNDILFTYVGTIGEVARIQEADKYYLAPNVSRIRIKNRLLSEFLMYYMDRDLFYQKIIFPLIATSSQPALSMANIREFNITYPSDTNEQQKIALVFNRISHLITLHQCKLEKLKLTKKALLQKLFPKNGKHIPEIRFKGFTDAWEQRKLSDVADVRDGTHDSPKFYNDGFPLVTSKNLKDGSIDFSDCSFISEQDFNEINKRSKVDLGDILFGMIGTIGKPAIVEHTGFAIKNVALIKEGDIINNRFIYHLLSSKVFDDYIARENAGGTQKFIALNQIRNFIFSAPTLAEQNKIIELLDYISQTITLHQRKLERLQEVKKGLLQKMFV